MITLLEFYKSAVARLMLKLHGAIQFRPWSGDLSVQLMCRDESRVMRWVTPETSHEALEASGLSEEQSHDLLRQYAGACSLAQRAALEFPALRATLADTLTRAQDAKERQKARVAAEKIGFLALFVEDQDLASAFRTIEGDVISYLTEVEFVAGGGTSPLIDKE